ncbi:MAG: hypothetical protein ACI4J4_04080 [Ruminiclostridium sp.]
MINLVGKWQISETIGFSLEKGMFWRTLDEAEAAGEDENTLKIQRFGVTVFSEDGTMETLVPLDKMGVTEEMIEALKEEGKTIKDGMLVLETKQWKTEEGKNYINSGITGEIVDEEVSPWAEIAEADENTIEMLGALRYKRAE